MPKINGEIIQVDDLIDGQTYRFRLRHGLITGVFGGFLHKSPGQPLWIMVPQGRDVISFPLSELLEIRYKNGGLIDRLRAQGG